MLEVKNLSKVYHSKKKNGTDTYALNNVSLSFPEKGMVFLLGKSGSGKSTLLNVCGGLDSPTEGEIIVKGRSSKDFTQSDFDSYRNTFIGFIFQEYNILNEFSVEDNIALALELQGKAKDKKAIQELLQQVDLEGFAKRKPNTLSGGQKQRIAIARALVKSPEIIMADEPTGALDSATGKQVFDTLKKLSADKLVIVVSHDREFAELYADRIIELKDGKILSDVTKTQEVQESISDNVTVIGDVLCIKQGSDLTDEDFAHIKSIIKNNSGDIIIAGGEKDVKSFKTVNRITDNGEKEVFKDTDESKNEKKTYAPEESRFIRSKLPIRHAARIGSSGLKSKPVRLFFTIVLCVVSFVLFGVLSTLMLYNNENTFKQTLKDANYDFVVFDKIYTAERSYYENGVLVNSYDEKLTARFSSEEIEEIKNNFGSGAFGAIEIDTQVHVRQASSPYWSSDLTNAAYMPPDAFARSGLIGSYPENEDEICVSSYFAKMLTECKTSDESGATIELNSYTDIVGKFILLDGYKFKVTGIFESGEIDPRFDVIKDNTNQDYSLRMEFEQMLKEGTHLLVGVSEDGLKSFDKRFGRNRQSYSERDNISYGAAYLMNKNDDALDDAAVKDQIHYLPFSKLNTSMTVWLGEDNNAISDSETVISFNWLERQISGEITTKRNELSSIIWELEQIKGNVTNINAEIETLQQQIDDLQTQIDEVTSYMESLPVYSIEYNNQLGIKMNYEDAKRIYEGQLQDLLNNKGNVLEALSSQYGVSEPSLESVDLLIGQYQKLDEEYETLCDNLMIIGEGKEIIVDTNGEETVKLYSDEERIELLRELVTDHPEFVNDLKLSFVLTSDGSFTPITENSIYSVAGIFIDDGNNGYENIYFTDKVVDDYWNIKKATISYSDLVTSYKDQDGALFTKLYVPYDHSDSQTDYLWNIYCTEDFSENGSKIELIGNHIENLQSIDGMVSDLSKAFFYIGLVLAIFAVLLFSNFISASISQKRNEIGILRAVGARSIDVFKIFFSESLVIAIICSVLSIIGSAVLCQVLNDNIGAAIGASIFVFGIVSVCIIIAIALLTAIFATFIPVWNAAKKKPVESIRAL